MSIFITLLSYQSQAATLDGFVPVRRGGSPVVAVKHRAPPQSHSSASWLLIGILLTLCFYFRRPLAACMSRLRRLPENVGVIFEAYFPRHEYASVPRHTIYLDHISLIYF